MSLYYILLEAPVGDKPISSRDEGGSFVSAADVWNTEKLEEFLNTLNSNRRLRLECEKVTKGRADGAKDQES